MFSVTDILLEFRSRFCEPSRDGSLQYLVPPALRSRSLEDAIHHLTYILRSQLTFDYDAIIGDARDTLLHFIQLGTVANFSSLIRTIQKVFAEVRLLRRMVSYET